MNEVSEPFWEGGKKSLFINPVLKYMVLSHCQGLVNRHFVLTLDSV